MKHRKPITLIRGQIRSEESVICRAQLSIIVNVSAVEMSYVETDRNRFLEEIVNIIILIMLNARVSQYCYQ